MLQVLCTGMYGTVLAVLAILAWLAAPAPPGQEPPSAKTPPPPSEIPFSRLIADAKIALALDPGTVATADALWIPRRDAGAVVRVDTTTNALGPQLAIGSSLCGVMAAGFDSLWAPLCASRTITRIDARTGAGFPVIPVAAAAVDAGIAVAVGSIWVVTSDKGVVSRIDPDTLKPVAEVYVAARPTALASSDEAIWAASEGDVLARINPHTNDIVETVAVGPRPARIAVGEGGVWTLNRGDGSVTRVDPKTNKVAATIPAGAAHEAAVIAAGEGSIWISAPGSPIVRIDPRSNRAVQRFTGEGGGAIVVAAGSLWVAAGRDQTWRLDPRLVSSMRPN